jgi:glycosyltransferase involved in cell wall biosynthesis
MPEHTELPLIAQEPVSVILLTRNDAACLTEVVRGWCTYLDGLQREYELLVVDDGSTDAWPESLAQPPPNVQILRHEQAQGTGRALRSGLEAARHPLVLYTDCDSLYEPADLKLLLDVIDQVHLAAGYRRRPSCGRSRLARLAYHALVRLSFGVRLRDVDCAFKLFRRSVFARIPIQSRDGFVHAEVLAKANFLGCLMTEVQLPERSRTRPLPALAEPSSLRQILKEANRVFHHPDFGPAELAKDPAEPGSS